jgi:hypothetical protein
VVLGACFAAVNILLPYVPIFTDEMSIKMQRARALLDGGRLITLFPQCGGSYSLPLPWSWWPARLFDAVLYQDLSNPIKLRYLGMIGAWIWLALMVWSARRILRGSIGTPAIVTGLFAFAGLGTLPVLLAVNRPEQPLIIGVTLAVVGPVLLAGVPRTPARTGLLFAGLVLVLCAIFTFHPKGLLFLPVVLVACRVFPSPWQRAAAVLLVGAFFVDTWYFMSVKLQCPDSSRVQTYLAAQMLQPSLTDPMTMLATGFRNLRGSEQYLSAILFAPRAWFNHGHELAVGPVATFINVGVRLSVLSAAVYFGFAWLRALWRDLSQRSLQPRTLAGGGLATSLVCLAFFQSAKPFYNAVNVVPLLALMVVLVLPEAPPSPRRLWPRLALGMLIGVSCWSQVHLVRSLLPNYMLGARELTFPNGTPIALSVDGFPAAHERTRATAALCGISPTAASVHVLVDDLTYPSLFLTREPFHSLYVGKDYFGVDDLEQLLRDHRSDGVVARCASLPASLRRTRSEDGVVCCVPAPR